MNLINENWIQYKPICQFLLRSIEFFIFTIDKTVNTTTILLHFWFKNKRFEYIISEKYTNEKIKKKKLRTISELPSTSTSEKTFFRGKISNRNRSEFASLKIGKSLAW